MVRETRYLWVANLPANVKEDRLKDYFRRFGRVQNVKLQKEGDVLAATVAFMDIKSAAKARYSDHSLDDKVLRLDYWEPGGPPPFSMRPNSENSRSPSGSPSPGRSRSRSSGHGSPRTRRSRSSSVSSGGSKSPRVQRTKLKNSVGLGPPLGSCSESTALAMCVKNLPLRSSDTSLKDGLFHEYKKHGKVICVKVVGQGPERFAVVTFKKSEDLEKAMDVSKDKMFFGSKIEVSRHEGALDVEDNEFRPLEAELDEYHPKATRTLFVGNLEREISLVELRTTFVKFGEIIDVDVKKQGINTVYAFIQFPDITSVVKAMREMDGEHLGANRIKLGFGKSMPAPVMWLDGIGENVPEKYLTRQMVRFGPILYTVLDRRKGHAMIFFEQTKSAVAAVQEMRGRSLGGRRLQVDFASKECQLYFLDNLEPSCADRPWEREIRELIGRPPPSRWSNATAHPTDRRSRGTTRGRTTTRSVDEFSQCSSGSREDLREGMDDPPSPFNSPRRYKTEQQKSRRNRSSESQGSDGEMRRRRPRSDSVESIRLSSRTRNASDSRGPEKIQLSHLTEAEPTVSSDSESECPTKKSKLSSSDSGVSDISIGDRLAGQTEPVKECDKKLGPQPKTIPLECRRRRDDEGSRPGTPLCDEVAPEDFLPDPRPVRERTCPRPMCLPVPKWYDVLPTFRFESPRAGRSPRSLTPRRDSSYPRSPVPADEECDSDSSTTPLADRTLEEKLKQLDLLYEKWCSRTSGDYMPLTTEMIGKFCEKPRVIDLELLKNTPSAVVDCVLHKRGVFDADFERLEKFSEKYEPKPIQGNDYLLRLQQLACSHMFRAQLPVEATQPQQVLVAVESKPSTSEEKSQVEMETSHMHPSEAPTSDELGTVKVEISEPEQLDSSVLGSNEEENSNEPETMEVDRVKEEVVSPSEEEVEIHSSEHCDIVIVPELASVVKHSEPVVSPSPTPIPSEVKEEVILVNEPSVTELIVDTPPSSIEEVDTETVVSEKLPEEEDVKTETQSFVSPPEVVAEAELVVEESKQDVLVPNLITVKPVQQKDKKPSAPSKPDLASVGSFESTLLGLEGPIAKVESKAKVDPVKSKDEKRRDETPKSSRSSKDSKSRDSKGESSSSREKSDTGRSESKSETPSRSESKSESVKRKSNTDRDDSKRIKLDEKSGEKSKEKEASKSGKSRHESSHSKDKHSSSRSKDSSRHHDKSRSDKAESGEKSKQERTKSDASDKVKSEPKTNSEKSRHESGKSRSTSSKDKPKEERSKDRKTDKSSSSRKSESKARDNTPKPEKMSSPPPVAPVIKTEKLVDESQEVDTSSFFPDLSSSDDEDPIKPTIKAVTPPPKPSRKKSSKSEPKSSKSSSKKKRSIGRVLDDSDEEAVVSKTQPEVLKIIPATVANSPVAESKKSKSTKELEKSAPKPEDTKVVKHSEEPKRTEVKAKEDSKPVDVKPKKKLDTREVFSSDDSNDDIVLSKSVDLKAKTSKPQAIQETLPETPKSVLTEEKKKNDKPIEKSEKKAEKKLDVRRVFSSDESDEESQPASTPSRPSASSSIQRPRLFSSSEDESAPPPSEQAKKSSDSKKSTEKSSGTTEPSEKQGKKPEAETKPKSSKPSGGEATEERDNDVKSKKPLTGASFQKSPIIFNRYESIYSSDEDVKKPEEKVKSPLKDLPFFSKIGSSTDDDSFSPPFPRRKKPSKTKLDNGIEAVSSDDQKTPKSSKKSKTKKSKSSNQPKSIYSSDEELGEEKPKSKGPSKKAELKPRKDEISTDDDVKLKLTKGPRSKTELKPISTDEDKMWGKPKPPQIPSKSIYSSEDDTQRFGLFSPERDRKTLDYGPPEETKSKKSKSHQTYTTDEESGRERKNPPKIHRSKSPRARSLSDSESDTDSDVPEKNIFIVEEEPIYISMYDKVKARSCKRVPNPATPVPSFTDKKKSRKSSGYDSERAKSAMSSCDEVERKERRERKIRQEQKSDSDEELSLAKAKIEEPIKRLKEKRRDTDSDEELSLESSRAKAKIEEPIKRLKEKRRDTDSDEELSLASSRAKAKIEEPIKRPKEKRRDTGAKNPEREPEAPVEKVVSADLFSEDSDLFAKISHKKSKKRTEVLEAITDKPDVGFHRSEPVEVRHMSPVKVEPVDFHSPLSDDAELEVRQKPKPRARPPLPVQVKNDQEEDPFDALLRTAKAPTYSPISSPKIFKHEERENIPEKKKKKKERRESFEILSESNKNNGFILPELVKLKSPSCEREVEDKLVSPKSMKSELPENDEFPPTPTIPELELVSDESRSDKSRSHKKKKKDKKSKEERKLAKKHKKSRSKSPAANRAVSPEVVNRPFSPEIVNRSVSPEVIKKEPLPVVMPKEEAPTPPSFATPEPPRACSSPTAHDSSFEEIRPTSSMSQSSFGKAPRPVVVSQKTEDAVAGLLEETFDFGGFSMKTDDELTLASIRAEEDRSLLYEAQKALQSLAEENQPSPLLEQALAGLAEEETFEAKQESALATESLQAEDNDDKDPANPFPNWQVEERSGSRFSLFSPLPQDEARLQSPKWASTFTVATTPPAPPAPKEKGDDEKKETSWDLSSIMRRAMNPPSDTQRKPAITTPTREDSNMKHPAFDTIPTRPARQRRGRKSIQEDGDEVSEPAGRGRGGRRKSSNRSQEPEVGLPHHEVQKEPVPQLTHPPAEQDQQKNTIDNVIEGVVRGLGPGTDHSPRSVGPLVLSPSAVRSANQHSHFLAQYEHMSPLSALSQQSSKPFDFDMDLQKLQTAMPLQLPSYQPVSQGNSTVSSPNLMSPQSVQSPSMHQVQSHMQQGITPITPVSVPHPTVEMGVSGGAPNPPKEERLVQKEERVDQIPTLTTPTRPSGVIRSGSKLEQIANRLRPAEDRTSSPAHLIPVAKVELPPGLQHSIEHQRIEQKITVKPERPSPSGNQPSISPQQRPGQAIITHGSHPQQTSPTKVPLPYTGPLQQVPPLARELLKSPEGIRNHSPFPGRPHIHPDQNSFPGHIQSGHNQPMHQGHPTQHHNQGQHMGAQNFMPQQHPNVHVQGHGQVPVSHHQGNPALHNGGHHGSRIVQQVNLPRQLAPINGHPQQHPGQHPQLQIPSLVRQPGPGQQYAQGNVQQAHLPPYQQGPLHPSAPQASQLPKQAHGLPNIHQQFQPMVGQPAQRPPVHHQVHANPGHLPGPGQHLVMQQPAVRPLGPAQSPGQLPPRGPTQKPEQPFIHREQTGQNVRMPIGAHQQTPNMQPFNRTPLPAHQGVGQPAQGVAAHQPRPVTPAHQANKQTLLFSGDAPVGISPPLAHGGSTTMTAPLQKQLQQVREQASSSPLAFRSTQHENREEAITPRVMTPGLGTAFDSATLPEVVRANSASRPGTDIPVPGFAFYQHFLRAQQQPGGRPGFGPSDERTADSPIMYRSPPPAPHAPVVRAPAIQTPPQASQVPAQADSLLTLLNQRYPVMWQGLLALKNDQAAVQMHFISGNASVARGSLPRQPDGSTLPLRISQRMRLEQTQLEGVARKMQMDAEHCILLALPCGRDHMDVLQQSNNLKNGFITYLQCKQAAGIVNIAGPGSQQAAFVVHVFPSCEFGNENLARIAPDLLHRISELAHLLVIIATV